jgi:hypothetical protein
LLKIKSFRFCIRNARLCRSSEECVIHFSDDDVKKHNQICTITPT